MNRFSQHTLWSICETRRGDLCMQLLSLSLSLSRCVGVLV
jgi:hypothetical protein